jgi:hypothetical protein
MNIKFCGEGFTVLRNNYVTTSASHKRAEWTCLVHQLHAKYKTFHCWTWTWLCE